MRVMSELPWAALLLGCTAVSVTTSLIVTLAVQRLQSLHKREKDGVSTQINQLETSSDTPIKKPVLDLRTLPADAVPVELRIEAYFAPERIAAFEHREIFRGCSHVFAVIDAIHPYLERFFRERLWVSNGENATILTVTSKRVSSFEESASDQHAPALTWHLPECIAPGNATEVVLCEGVDPRTFAPDKIINLETQSSVSAATPQKKHIIFSRGALILGGVFDVSEGSIFIGKHVRIEPNAYIKGPCIIGDNSMIRSGAYVRGDLLVGRHVVLRGELKNSLIMDHAELCHPGYCGDSLCGFKSHFGNQVTTANLNLFYNTAHNDILVDTAHARYNTGRKKIGVVLGDYSQLGCSSVTDPCTLLRSNTIVYTLTRLRKGIYGPHVIVKNKPLEKGVLEVAPLRLPPPEKEPFAVVEEVKKEEAKLIASD